MMKRLMCMGRRVAMTAALAGLLLPAACVQEDGGQTGRATVTLTVTTRANEESDASLAYGEGMKHLRVIMVNQTNNRVIYNWDYEFQDTKGQSVTVTFNDVVVGTYTFYAIANESSFDTEDTFANIERGSIYRGTGFEDTLLDENPEGFVLDTSHGIPAASVVRDVEVTSNRNLTLTLIRVVAKIRLSFINTTGEEVDLSDVQFGNFFPNPMNGYLVGDGQELNMPSDIGYKGKEVGTNGTLTIPVEGYVQTYYLYESSAGENAYKLSGSWGNTTMPDVDFEMNSLLRNTQLNVIVTLKKTATPQKIDLKWKVVDWGEEEIDVPVFN